MRMKTELLVQMDGLAKTDDLVFLLAASNLPWELDPAMLRRLEKRILVGLPNHEARRAMFLQHLPAQLPGESVHLQTQLDYDRLADATDGYSGSDIKLVCKEVAMRSLRTVFETLESQGDGAHGLADLGQVKLPIITTEIVLKVLESTKPSAAYNTDKYTSWQEQFESV
eukprot:Colp12_sorted_trinity150504_noHs@13049